MQAWIDQIVTDVGRNPVLAAWFTAGGAILAATVSALVAFLVAQRSVYMNAVTAERSKWIEALRGTISQYSGAAGKISARRRVGEYDTDLDWATDTEALQTLLSDLTLRLNPTEDEARHLLFAARKVNAAARLHSPAAFILANEIMIRHAQWVAKGEWERVKQEASGALAWPWFAWRSWRRGLAYAAFLEADGSLKRLDLIGAGKSDAELTLARSEMDVITRRSFRFRPFWSDFSG